MSDNAYKIYFTLIISIFLFSLAGFGFTHYVGLLPRSAEYFYNLSAISFIVVICSTVVFFSRQRKQRINH